ncbi:SGNH/GDSL hydrolase family protein [Pelagibacteraceae bacterium]|nr:SGNH/GDSL hydrolase family protein [Pelagibacteraceae bacterium]
MNDKKLNLKITFFGDSIFTGQGVSIYKGWVTKLASFFDDYSKDLNYEFLITNSSVNGRTTRIALEDMQYQVMSQGVDILVLQFGLNDCNCWATDFGMPRVSKAAYIENLKEIIDRARVAGASKILLNNNHPTSRTKVFMPGTDKTFEDSNKEYSLAVNEVCSKLGPHVRFQNIYQSFKDVLSETKLDITDFLLEDGLHLNERGHEVYYSLMRPLIISATEDIVQNKFLVLR